MDAQGRMLVGTDRGLWRSRGRFDFVTPTNEPVDVTFVIPLRSGGLWMVAKERMRKFVDGAWVDVVGNLGRAAHGIGGDASGRIRTGGW